MSVYMIVLSIVITLLCTTNAQYRFDCHESYCATEAKQCGKVDDCENGILFKNATACGCCHICVKYLNEGDECELSVLGVYPNKICGPQLVCKDEKCVKADTKCMKDLKKFMESNEVKLFGRTKPECDDFGFYNSTVCISDVLCYCVDKNGKRIFGTDVAARKQDMNCSCSREYEEFSKRIEFDKEDFLRCRPNGDYDVVQCTEDSCYCMKDYEGEIDEEDLSNIQNLKCFPERHIEDGEDKFLRSKCWRERKSLLDQIENLQRENLTVIGVDVPQCDLDGSYAPVQSKKNITFCVSRNGRIIEETVVPRNSESAKKMNCRCARDTEMLRNEKERNKNMNAFAKFKCTNNGDFEIKQNVEGSLITVDREMGYQ